MERRSFIKNLVKVCIIGSIVPIALTSQENAWGKKWADYYMSIDPISSNPATIVIHTHPSGNTITMKWVPMFDGKFDPSNYIEVKPGYFKWR